jgi:AraC-like DNA-binding protein
MTRGQERTATGWERKPLPRTALHFSLDTLDVRDRLPLWQDMVCRSITGCRAQVSDWAQEFRADLDLVAGARVSIAHSNTFGLGTVRDRSCIRDDDDHLVYFLKLDGITRMQVGERRFHLTAGDGVLVDYAAPFDMQAAGTLCELLVLRLPREMIGAQGARSIGLGHKASSPVLRLLHGYAREAFGAGALGGGLHPMAERHLAELVAALYAAPSEPLARTTATALNQARLMAIREEIARSHANPCLTLKRVSGQLGFSERLGQLILNREGTSFTDLLHQHRLDRAYERLAMPGARVSDVAYAVGFSDLSHFHRLFKARFGHTPADTRQAACTP